MGHIISWASLNKKVTRQRAWKVLNIVVAAVTIVNVSALGMLVRPNAAQAASAVWTTRVTCETPAPQDENEYANGETIYVRGGAGNFDPNTTVYGKITGNPGGSSADPNEVVKEFTASTDSTGYFCVGAYVVGSDGDLDDGVYTVDVWDNAAYHGGSKNDNYHVNGVSTGQLVLTKVVDTGSASPDDFSFTINPNPLQLPPVHTQNGTYSFGSLPPDNYTISEVAPSGYHPVSTTCTDKVVVAGQTATCEMHNARDTQNVTIVKEVIGGDALPSDWTFTLSNSEATYTGIKSGVPVSVFTGTYALAEDGPSGYHFFGQSGNCYNDGGLHLYTNSEGPNTCTVTNAQDSLTIAKTDNHTTALPGETLTYHVTVTNHSDATASGVNVSDTIPAHLSNITTISNGGLFSAGIITWTDLTVPALGSLDLTFNATIDATMPNGATNLHNVANLCWNPQTPDVAAVALPEVPSCFLSSTATDDTSVTAGPTLGLTKTASPTTVNPLTNVTYTINWSVSGNANATSVLLTDPVPTNITFVSAANGGTYNSGTKTITWDLGTKAPGTSGSVSWVGQIASTAPAGAIVNTASIDSAETDPAIAASATITVVIPRVLGVTSPHLTLTKTASPTTTNPGKTITYTLVVGNTGDGAATNVVVTDTLPAGFTFVETGDATKSWLLGTLAAGASQTLTAEVTVGNDIAAGTYTNTAVAKADGLDPVTATANVTVIVPKVLGLATTGVSARDNLLFAFGATLLALGFLSLRRRQTQSI